MSWIYGYYHKQGNRTSMPALRTALFEFHTANADIYAGGNPQTCQSFTHPHDPSRHVVVLGNPIIRNGEDFNYPDNTAWSLILSDEERLKSLDGHWVILIIAGDEILAYNDSMCKRTLYIQEDSDRIFWCSELALLKDICKPEIDWESFGAYWHGMFPPTRLYYAPTQKSYFKGVQMLGTGTKAVIAATGITLQRTEWLPSKSIHNLENMLKNMTLLPVRAGKKICVGLTGGMDIRPLIAIYLANGAKLQAVHFGSDKTADFRVARQIASRYKIPFRFIGYEESGVSWEQAKLYIQSRGMGFNPAACDFMGYYPKIAQDSEVYISGYFGELFRFRFMMAHLKTLVLGSHLTYHAIGNYLYANPPSFFIPEIARRMHRGFWSELRSEVSLMPDSGKMLNPMLMHLFYVRHSPRANNMPNLAWIDNHVIDHMPYLQSSLVSEHFRYGFLKQLNEGLHRDTIHRMFPALETFPITLSELCAPYHYRQLAMKLKMRLHYRNKLLIRLRRDDVFLQEYKSNILELRHDTLITQDAAIDHKKLDQILDAYYAGDKNRTGAVLSFVCYAMGK